MGMFKFAAALALLAGSLGFASTVSAQRHDDRRGRIEQSDRRGDVRRGDVKRRDVRRAQFRRAEVRRAQARRDDRRYRQPQRRDIRRRASARNCKMIWRNQRRVRVCR